MAVRRRGIAWTGCVLVPLGRVRTQLCNQRRSRQGIPIGLWHHIPHGRHPEGSCRRSGNRRRGRALKRSLLNWNRLRLSRPAPQAPYSVHLGSHSDSGLQVPRLNGDADGGLGLRSDGALHGRKVDGLAWRSYRWEHRQVHRGRPLGRRRRTHDGLGTSIPGPRAPTNMQDALCLVGSLAIQLRLSLNGLGRRGRLDPLGRRLSQLCRRCPSNRELRGVHGLGGGGGMVIDPQGFAETPGGGALTLSGTGGGAETPGGGAETPGGGAPEPPCWSTGAGCLSTGGDALDPW